MEEIGSEPEQHAPPSSFSQGMVAPFHASCTLHDVSVTQVRLAGQEDGCAYMAAYSARETSLRHHRRYTGPPGSADG